MALLGLSDFFAPVPASERRDDGVEATIMYAVAASDSDGGSVTVRFSQDIDGNETPEDRDGQGILLEMYGGDREDLIWEDEWAEYMDAPYNPNEGPDSSNDNCSDEEPEAPQEVE